MNQMDLTYLENISPQYKRIYLLLCNSWNLLQNWPHTPTQSKSQQRKEHRYSTLHPIWPPWVKANSEFTNSWKRNSSLLNEKWLKTEVRKLDFLELSKNEFTTHPNLWCPRKDGPKRQVHMTSLKWPRGKNQRHGHKQSKPKPPTCK